MRRAPWLTAVVVVAAMSAFSGGVARAGSADVTISDVRPADPRGVVAIRSLGTTVHVVGWARNEVSVHGTLGASSHVEFHVANGRTTLRVTPMGDGHRGGDLEIKVPAASLVELRTMTGDASVRDVTGTVEVESLSGKIQVSGAPSDVNARSTGGDVTIDATAPHTRARSVSGAVRVHGARGAASVESVSGNCELQGSAFDRVDARSVSGAIAFDGSLAAQGSIELRSHSGNVRMVVPPATSGEFEVRSYHGALVSHLGVERSSTGSLEFKAGAGGTAVRVRSFSGDVTIDVRK